MIKLIILSRAYRESGGVFDIESLETRLNELNTLMEDKEIWNDINQTNAIMKERSKLSVILNNFTKLTQSFTDNIDLLEIARQENDIAIIQECENEIDKILQKVQKTEVECLFSADIDGNDCFMEIHSGAGGTESNDWAEMLLRMYTRWAEIFHGYKVEIPNRIDGEEVGVKSVTLKIFGYRAYGWAKTESGVHRLVRMSPFNANGKRHTSFASVWVYPVINDSINIEINEKDIRIDTYRSSGAGGQHVNKTESAIRITHLPTKIVAQCQNNRSQHRNREEAFQMLRSRLYNLEIQKREEEEMKTRNNKVTVGWGNQIRSYFMQPYQLVKDLRTQYESSNVNAIMDGDLDEFISTTLTYMAMQNN